MSLDEVCFLYILLGVFRAPFLGFCEAWYLLQPGKVLSYLLSYHMLLCPVTLLFYLGYIYICSVYLLTESNNVFYPIFSPSFCLSVLYCSYFFSGFWFLALTVSILLELNSFNKLLLLVNMFVGLKFPLDSYIWVHHLYWFHRTDVTKYQEPQGLNNSNVSSHSSGGL